MARGGCRDCGRCTESWAQWLVLEPFRFFFYWLFLGWLLGLFFRGCPRCGHKLWAHQKLAGRFAD